MRGVAEEMNPRTCIVTRQAREADELIRFVAGPDGVVTPDLRHRLPGRGVWVTASRATVAEAVRKRLFGRGLKAGVSAPETLAADIDGMLERDALDALSLANKAGAIRTGAMKAEKLIRTGSAVLLLEATDAAPDGMRKLAQAIHARQAEGGTPVAVRRTFSAEQMGLALGGDNVVHAAAIAGGATTSLIGRLDRLERYRA